jgi:hypothetical protein
MFDELMPQTSKEVSDRMVATLSLFRDGNKQPLLSNQKVLFEFAQMLYHKLIQRFKSLRFSQAFE